MDTSPSSERTTAIAIPAPTLPPSGAVVVDLRDHRPPWTSRPEIHLVIRLDEDHQPAPPPQPGHVRSPQSAHELRPVPQPPARKLKNPTIRLRRKESLQEGTQRLSLEHLDYAINVLLGGALSPDKTVHEARKAMRRVRGLLRLVRAELGPDVYRFENAQLRDAGRLLSEARSAAVALDTLATVEGRYAKLLAPDVFAGVRDALEARRFSAVEHAIGDPEQRRQIVRTLRSARARHAALPLEGTLGKPRAKPSIRNSYKAIAPGIARTYHRGRLGMADAYRSPSAESFHQWRKRARYLRFQLETLTGIWPEVIEGLASSIDDLGETLGEAHDLAELKRLINYDHALVSGKRRRELLTSLIEQRRQDIHQQARAKGVRVYAEATDRFVERLGVYWAAWR